jgi:hypothetical protein
MAARRKVYYCPVEVTLDLLREHLLRDGRDHSLQLPVAQHPPFLEVPQDQRLPAAADLEGWLDMVTT